MKASLLVALLGLVLCTGTGAAQDIVWNGASGAWNTASNWTPANVPNAPGEVAILPVVAGPYTVDLNVAIGLVAVRLEGAASTFRLGTYGITLLRPAGLSNAGTIRANNGTSLLSGDIFNLPEAQIVVEQGRQLNLAGPVVMNDGTIWVNHTGGYDSDLYFADSVTVSGAGDIYINGDSDGERLHGATDVLVTQAAGHTVHGGGSIQTRFLNAGIVRADKPSRILAATVQGFDNQGIAEASGGAELRFTALPINYGSRELSGGTWRAYENSRIRFNGAYIDSSNAAIVLHGPGSMIYANLQTADALAGFANNKGQGSFTLEAGRTFTRNGAFRNAGSVAVLDSSAFTVSGANTYTQTGGVTRVDGHFSATAINLIRGGLTGTGTVTGDVVSSGWVAPGASVGTLTLEGDYEQATYGRLRVEIGGASGSVSDLLLVTGQVQLDPYGYLDVTYRPDGIVLVARELDPAGVEEIPIPEPQPAAAEVPSSIRLVTQQDGHTGAFLRLDLPDPGAVCVEVFNVTGQREALLSEGQLTAGSHSFACGGQSGGRAAWGSGVYFARARVQRAGESVTKTVRLVILK